MFPTIVIVQLEDLFQNLPCLWLLRLSLYFKGNNKQSLVFMLSYKNSRW